MIQYQNQLPLILSKSNSWKFRSEPIADDEFAPCLEKRSIYTLWRLRRSKRKFVVF